MNRLRIFFILLIFIVLFLPSLAFAESISVLGDWELSYSSSFQPMENGGVGQIGLYVKNIHASKDIKLLGCGISNTNASNSSDTKDVSIAPGESETHIFGFQIDESDMDMPIRLTVAIRYENEDGASGWGIDDNLVFSLPSYDAEITLRASDDSVHLNEDVDVFVDINYSGNEDVKMSIFDENGDYFASLDRVVPGQSVGLKADYDNLMERTTLQYSVNVYSMDGARLLLEDIKSNVLVIEIEDEPLINCDFDIHLTADKTNVEAGEDVNFSILITNTGDGIEQFEITDMDAMTISRLEGLAPLQSGTVPITQSFSETQDVSFVVVAVIGDMQKALQTNTVSITVGETDELNPILAIQPEIEPNSEDRTPQDSDINQDSDNQNNTNQNDDELLPVENNINPSSNYTNVVTIALVIVIGLLLIALVIIVYLVIDKNREGSRKNNLR